MREVLICSDRATLWSLMESSVAELLMPWMSITHSVSTLVSSSSSYVAAICSEDLVDKSDFASLLLAAVPSISIIIDDKGTNPVAGLNYSLSCEVSGVDSNTSAGVSVSYEWKKDDTLLSETGPLLSFSPLRLSDAGEYSCTINMHGCPFKRSRDISKIEGSYINTLHAVHAGTRKCTL